MRPALDRPGVTDEALMLLAQADDAVAFAELYGRHLEYSLLVARAICRDSGRAEDAVQEGFFSIWRSRGDYRPQVGSFRVWSMRIVRNRAIESFRVVGTRPRIQGAGSTEESTEVDRAASPLSMVIARGERTLMLESLRQLPDAQAEVIALSFYGDFTQTEIATRLGVPMGTVKGRMRLGLQKLRTEWLATQSRSGKSDPVAPR